MNADTVYSLTLLGSLVAAVVSLAAAIRYRRFAIGALVIALLFGAVSVAVHATIGHGADSPEPMSVGQFVANHKAYVVVAALAVLTTVLLKLRTPR